MRADDPNCEYLLLIADALGDRRPSRTSRDDTTVRAMKAGAVEFLVKPFRDDDLLRAIPRASEISACALRDQARLVALHSRYASLTPREREVMGRIVFGKLNKQVALELGITEGTVKVHRFKAMRKMRADSIVDLAGMAARLRTSLGRW